MALQKSFGDPSSTQPIPAAYIRINQLMLDFSQQVGRMTVSVYRDKAARDANLSPVNSIAYDFARDTQEVGFDQATGKKNFAFPGFNDLVAGINAVPLQDGKEAFDAVRGFLYEAIKGDPKLEGATDV